MKVFVENASDYRLSPHKIVGEKIEVTVNIFRSEDGLRFFPEQKTIILDNGNWWEVQIEFDKALMGLEDGNLLG